MGQSIRNLGLRRFFERKEWSQRAQQCIKRCHHKKRFAIYQRQGCKARRRFTPAGAFMGQWYRCCNRTKRSDESAGRGAWSFWRKKYKARRAHGHAGRRTGTCLPGTPLPAGSRYQNGGWHVLHLCFAWRWPNRNPGIVKRWTIKGIACSDGLYGSQIFSVACFHYSTYSTKTCGVWFYQGIV